MLKIGDVVRFEYGDAILIGKIDSKPLLAGWFVVEVERPKGFVWRNDEPFHVMMPEEALTKIKDGV